SDGRKYADDLPRHRRMQLLRPFDAAAGSAAAAERARIAHINREARALHPQVQVGGGALALHLERLPIDNQRQHVGTGDHGVNVELLAIEFALPAIFQLVQFELVVLAVDGNLVNHSRFLIDSARPESFQREGASGALPLPFVLAPALEGSSTANSPAAMA